MSDLNQLQGTWRVTALEMNGASMPAAMLAAARVVIKGTSFTSLGMGAVYAGEMSIDEAPSPKTFAVRFALGPEGGATNSAIYTLEDETWRFCLNIMGGPAPTAFATRPGDGNALETLVREA